MDKTTLWITFTSKENGIKTKNRKENLRKISKVGTLIHRLKRTTDRKGNLRNRKISINKIYGFENLGRRQYKLRPRPLPNKRSVIQKTEDPTKDEKPISICIIFPVIYDSLSLNIVRSVLNPTTNFRQQRQTLQTTTTPVVSEVWGDR